MNIILILKFNMNIILLNLFNDVSFINYHFFHLYINFVDLCQTTYMMRCQMA